jgi:rhomboid domain-containing protein 1
MRRTREKSQFGVFLLINELIKNDRLPPVSLSVVVANIVIYLELFNIEFPSLYEVCLSVNNILKSKQYHRIVLSAFFHADDWHLYYNMVSFGMKGRSLEKRFGSVYFAVLLSVFTVACGLVYIAVEYLAAYLFESPSLQSSCAVGFSGVIFALKVLTTHFLSDGAVYMFDTIYIPRLVLS